MFIVSCNIKIGAYTFTRCGSITIDKNANIVCDTATITVPTTAVLISNGEKTTIETAKAIKEGMPVTITLAYKNVYEDIEFKGYVKRINYKIPLEIECEDAVYLLRKKTISKAWKSTTLKEVLEEIINGTGIELADNIAELNMAAFNLKKVNGAFALQEIKDDYKLTIYINDEGKLYAGLAYTDVTGSVKYKLTGEDTNVINADDLKYHNKEDVLLKVKAIGISGNRKKTTVTVGDADGELRTLHFYNVHNESELEKLAKQELDKLKYDGYEGSIQTFLIPPAKPGMTAIITDDRFAQREGSFYIDRVKTTFGTGGARREVGISIKI